jgi:GntP family gluconate:H+ symporter
MMTLIFLVIIICAIIFATAKLNLHPFLTLLLAAIIMGFLSGLDARTVIERLTEGFGNTLKSIGIVIACGTIIGTFLEKSGGARSMAASILKSVGEKRAPLAMSITGFIISIPVFCDSGFVILSTLNKALSRKTGLSLAVLAIALATGLYTTHVFVPPTPGPLAAAATLGADIGLIILLGLIVSIPTAITGLIWARYYCNRFSILTDKIDELSTQEEKDPSPSLAFTPLIVPIFLIALKSIADYPSAPFGIGLIKDAFSFIGHPVFALLVGVFISFGLRNKQNKEQVHFDWVALGLKNAGVIILITGAGGAFGTVLRATGIGDTMGEIMSQWQVGILLPFLISAVLKSAQGSSTVAIITTAALIAPLLGPLSLATPVAKALVVLAIGAGSMTVSHINDSYFWVVAQFSNMDTATALRCHTLATLIQGFTGITVIAGLAWILL